jgi:acyl carrier protein
VRHTDRSNQKESTPMAEKPTEEEILAGLAEIVEEVAGVEADEVTADKSFVDDLDIDSLSMVEIAVQAEDRFEVKIPDAELANLKTVGDAVSYVAKNV